MVLHLLLVHLKSGITGTQRDRLITSFSGLLPIHDVMRLGCVTAGGYGSTHDLVFLAYLKDATALERFGTDARYMRYLQRSFLPLVEDFVGVDVRVDAGRLPAASYESAVCFCLDVPPTTYDWQVRSLLSRLTETSGTVASATLGIALNERQPYRAAGVIYAPPDRLEAVAQTLADAVESETVTETASVAGRLLLRERA